MLIVGEIPEILEFEQGESLDARTRALASFRSLGPPDLVQLTKFNKAKESSTYHYISGIDVSSSASIAAHLNTLTFSLGETQTWFGRHPQWKIVSGTYCTWNTFSHIDIRVNAKIPGSVDAYALDVRGDRHTVSDHHWLEAYMSAMVRSLVLVDSDTYFVASARHEDPIPDKRAALTFFSVFEKLFYKGPMLGASPQVQPATLDKNYMVDAFFEVIKISGLYSSAIELLTRLAEQSSEANSLLVKVELLASEETKAVKLMVDTVTANPRDSHALAIEAEFCLKKGALDLALDCALRSAASAPGEFYAWEILSKVYIALGQYDQALLTLNSSPLVPSAPIDAHRMPPSKKVHSPLPTDGSIDEVWEVDSSTDTESADPTLLRLPAATLKGSSKSAYNVLASIFSHIGWVEMMRIRGQVFLMEVEAKEPKSTGNKTELSNGDLSPPQEAAVDEKTDTENVPEAPSEAVSTEVSEKSEQNGNVDHTVSEGSNGSVIPADQAKGTIKSKRLCERRLDSLFMVLFEDVRAYSNWQREAVHFESQQLPYIKTAFEWEILGGVAQRLGHTEQALEAYESSLSLKFSHRVIWGMLDIFAPEENEIADVVEALDCVVKLIAWNHRWYREFSPRLNQTLGRIVALEGLTKIRNRLEAGYDKTDVLKIINIELQKLEKFGAPGIEL